MKYMKLGSKPDAFQADGSNIRFVATELATDVTVNVGDVKFYLHKFPLLSKSCRLQTLLASTDEEDNNEIDISDIPGGPPAFEICAKFCYGMTVTLNPYNVVSARCAAEYLGMNENIEKGNLIYKIEVFLNSIFRSWKDSIIVLQTTKSLLPSSEDTKVVFHCIDSIASKASIDPSEVEWSYTYNRKKLPSENGSDQHWNGVRKQQSVPDDWWVEDLCELDLDLYKRVIVAIKTEGKSSGQVMGEALKAYTYRRLRGFGKGAMTFEGDAKSRRLLETIVWLLPTDLGSVVNCSFLLKLLNAAILLDSGEMCKKDLVKRIGRQLEQASVSELLIPAPASENTIYDINMVVNLVKEFVMQDRASDQDGLHGNQELQEIRSLDSVSNSKLAVAKLIDGYLAEVANDPNLHFSKFVEFAQMASESSRPVHDGLYRAIDMYLKEHPGLTKSEKKKICSLLDCRRLSVDTCSHAMQNERLPLRLVVQILYFQQVRSSPTSSGDRDQSGSSRPLPPRESDGSYGSSRSAATEGDVNSLKSMNLVGGRVGGSESSSDGNKNGGEEKVKGVAMVVPKMKKKMLSKLWSGKAPGGGETNSSSDASDSPGGSVMPEEDSRSMRTDSRNVRYSVS